MKLDKIFMNLLNTNNNLLNINYNILSISCNAIICIIITLLYDNTHNKIFIKTLISCLTVMFLFKFTIKRKRPYHKFLHISNNDILPTNKNYSFPSVHVMSSVIISLLLQTKLTHNIPIFPILPIFIIISRIGLGVHYLSDCLFSLFMTYFVNKFIFYYL